MCVCAHRSTYKVLIIFCIFAFVLFNFSVHIPVVLLVVIFVVIIGLFGKISLYEQKSMIVFPFFFLYTFTI